MFKPGFYLAVCDQAAFFLSDSNIPLEKFENAVKYNAEYPEAVETRTTQWLRAGEMVLITDCLVSFERNLVWIKFFYGTSCRVCRTEHTNFVPFRE